MNLPGMIGIVLLAPALGNATQPDPLPDVTVDLRIATVATPGVVEQAKVTAVAIFAGVGITLTWRGHGRESGAGVPVLIELNENSRAEEQPDALAETFPFAGVKCIMIRYDRVRQTVGASKRLEPLLLAHVMVHELAHVLQCVDRHSLTGIMKARWTQDDYRDMLWRPLTFTEEDIELLNLGLQYLRAQGGSAVTSSNSGHPR